MCTGFLVRRDCAVIEPDPAATRGKVVRLTGKGVQARANYERNLAATEERWRATYGAPALRALRAALEPLVGDGTLGSLSPGRRTPTRNRQLAGLAADARDAAPLPHGAAPRRLPRRQLRAPHPRPTSPDRSAGECGRLGTDAPLSS